MPFYIQQLFQNPRLKYFLSTNKLRNLLNNTASVSEYEIMENYQKTLKCDVDIIGINTKYIDDELQQRMTYEGSRDKDSILSRLSTREFEIFCLLAEGLNTNEISKKLNISYKTSANYSTNIKSKLGASTVADVARIAIRYNIIKA